MNDTTLHETSMAFDEQKPTKETRSRGRPAYAEKAPRELRDDFALEIMKGVLAGGAVVDDAAALSRHCYKIADALCKVRGE